MKLTSIDLRNHLSHESTRIDFDGARLVTISGANGAGKSSLLEALKYVLFDDGRARTDDLVRLGSTDMAASVEFDFADGHYRATRGRTTKSGGRSYLELAVAVGADWMPLTGDDIRSTQARIRELLGMDAETFATAVFLGQGQANRFAEATAGDRKRILGQVLGLERYERAERVARDRIRDVDFRIAADRTRFEGMEAELATRPTVEELLAQRERAAAAADLALADLAATLEPAEARLLELTAAIATADAQAQEVARLQVQRDGLQARWRGIRERQAASETARAAAAITLSDAAAVEAAIAELPAARARVEAVEAADPRAREIDEELRAKRAAQSEARAAIASWTASYESSRQRVDELAPAVAALEPVICEKCGHANVVDQADLRGRLASARQEFAGLEASRPQASLSSAREEAAITRLELKRDALESGSWEQRRTAREAVTAYERLAAKAEGLEAARATKAREEAASTAAAAELAEVEEAGRQIAGAIEEARAKLAAVDPLRAEQATVRATIATTKVQRTALEVARRQLEGHIATSREELRRLDELHQEASVTAARIAVATLEYARLRKLVTAFGAGGIPARIIEGVLPELGRYANELLEQLRPGMVLELRAQRAKRDGSGLIEALDLLVRDAAGERPLSLFSGGERMSVSLAIAVGLSRLVARRAGAAIRTLVVDEPDGLDAEARRAFGQALRILAHQGELERVVVVSHHEDLAEVGDAQYRVTKAASGSVVEQVS